MHDVSNGVVNAERATATQQKTQHPLQFRVAASTSEAIVKWVWLIVKSVTPQPNKHECGEKVTERQIPLEAQISLRWHCERNAK